MGVVLETRFSPMVKLLATDSVATGTSFTDPADTLTDPSTTAGVISWGRLGAISPNSAKIIPFGTGVATNTLLMAVYAIQRILGAPNSKNDTWTYHLLAAFTCTLCTKAGIAGSTVDASHLYCDTIAIITGSGTPNVSCEIVSPGTNQAGHVIVDGKGGEDLYIGFARNGSATAANALVGRL
jgi:hypothetical protein